MRPVAPAPRAGLAARALARIAAGAVVAASILMVACATTVARAQVPSPAHAQAPAPAGALRVATWNLQWLLDRDTHRRWVETCARHGWPTDPGALAETAQRELAGLPWCNALNGMAFPPDRCASEADGWPRRARYPASHPCRDSADLAEWRAYEDKLAQLRRWFARLADEGVALVALQEVYDESAVRAILPPGWSVRTSRSLPDAPDIAQQVGVAWAPGVRPRDFALHAALADSGVPGRTLRPGFAFTVDVAGQPVEFLVVHLKAGCRSRVIDDPLRPNDPPHRHDAIVSDCAMLRHQLPALAAWVDARAGRELIVLGDFNRSILQEAARDRPDRPARLDGTPASAPLGPCRIETRGERRIAHCPSRVGALFPEINDDEPPGSVLWRAVPAGLRGGRIRAGGPGDCSLPTSARPGRSATDLAHDGIDHILLGAALKRRLTARALELNVLGPTGDDGRPLTASANRAQPSDHCPHWVELAPLGAP
jgi:endonuclease/exonuclease/phosphatase family metal-dependent hydrolase